MTNATFYLAFACFVLAALSVDRLWSFLLMTLVAVFGVVFLLGMAIREVILHAAKLLQRN